MPDENSDVPAKGTTGPSPPESAVPEVESVARGEDWESRFKYLFADFENFRRRSERERETMTRQVRAGLLRELLPILEGFHAAEEALAHLPPSDPVRRGLEILDREWMTFLKHEGVEPVAVVGHTFRAEEAEAVGETPATAEHPTGTITEVVQQGYRFFGGLLRPAKVIVARGTAPPPGTGPAAETDEEES